MAGMRLSPQAARALLGILLVSVLVAATAAVLSTFQVFLQAKVDTQSYCIDNNVYGGGGFPDTATAEDQVKRGELFDSSSFFYSWSRTGVSEKVIVSGKLWGQCPGNLNPFRDSPSRTRYLFEIDTGSGFEVMQQDDFPGGFIEFQFSGSVPNEGVDVPTRIVQIDGISYRDASGVEKGIKDGSVFRVKLAVGYTPAFGTCCEWKEVARDESHLRSALARVQRGAAQYQVGQTGEFRWSTPVVRVDGATAYFLTLTDENTGSALPGWDRTALTTTAGAARFNVSANLFSTSAAARNTVRASLFSQVFQAAVEDVTVIDNADLAPRMTSVKLNQREFREGDGVVVEMVATPNPTTRLPIVRYHVLGEIDGFIVFDEDSTDSTVRFTALRTGVLEVEAVAYDSASRPTPVFEVSATVGNVIVECEVHPELPQCGAKVLANLLLWAIGLVITFVVAVMVAVVMPQKPSALRPLVLLLIILAGAAVLVVMLGAPEVA